MADGLGSKVSILPETETLDDSDLIYVVSGGASKKMTVGNAKTEFGGGGGGGSSQTVADVLWSGSATPSTTGTDITLSHAISDYDFIVFTVNQNSGYDSIVVIAVNELTVGESYIETGYGGSSMDVFFDYTSDTTINIKSSASAYLTTYTKITGLKFCGTLAPMIYSFEEREIGVWTDGKPLYQRTFTGTNSGGGNINIEWDKSNIDVKNIFGEYITSSGSVRAMPFSASSTWHRIYADELHIGILVETNVTGVAYVTAQYTKKSDVPGSGKYGSLGVPMVHYDNTERVVGTYFGKTLYQKSYTNFSSLTGQSRTLDFGLSGIDKIWYVSEGCVISDGLYPFPYIHWDPSNVVGGFWDLNDGSPRFEFRTGTQSTSAVINTFTIRYTKTTD